MTSEERRPALLWRVECDPIEHEHGLVELAPGEEIDAGVQYFDPRHPVARCKRCGAKLDLRP